MSYIITIETRLSTTVILTGAMGKSFDGQRETRIPAKALSDDKLIADVVKTEMKMAERDAEWKIAAEVLNIYSLIIHVLAVLFTFCLIFVDARAH